MTVGVRAYEIKVPFGVVECEDVARHGAEGEATFTLLINAGIYLLEPAAGTSSRTVGAST